jgi:hypothetical protein
VVWEYYSLDGWRALRAGHGEVEDQTRSLTLDGTIRLRVPAGSAPRAIGAVGSPLYYVRCRFQAGAYDSAPRLLGLIVNPIRVRQQAPVWSTVALAQGATANAPQAGPPQPLTLEFGPGPRLELTRVVPGSQGGPLRRVVRFVPAAGGSPGSLTLDAEVGLLGSGLPDQEIRLGRRPVADGEVELWSVEGVEWRRWEQRPDLDASLPVSRHFTLDPFAGVIRFGDGVRGRVPPTGSAVLTSYRSTLGTAGAVPEGRTWTLARQAWNESVLPGPGATIASVAAALAEVRNPFATTAGEDLETLESLEARAVAQLRAHETLVDLARTAEPATSPEATLDQLDPTEVRRCAPPRRATTLLDYERLALDVPGTLVRRAKAWANLDPGYPGLEAAGTVSVIVVPSLPRGRPRPSPGLLRAVRRYLDRRRVLCTRLVVTGPEYLTVTVRAQVRAFRNADPERVRAAVVEALHALFDPLEGGPRRRGWPFGRDVYRSEVLAQIDVVTGVDHVTSCTLAANGREAVCGNVCLPPTWLVASGDHVIEVVRP